MLMSTRKPAEVKGGKAPTAFPTNINTQIFFVPSLEIYLQGFPTSAAGFSRTVCHHINVPFLMMT